MTIPYARLSGFYFFYFATLGAFIPYWGLNLKEAGYSAQQIGALSAILSATRIIAPNLWGWLADRTGKNLSIIRACCFFAMLFYAGFLVPLDYTALAAITVCFGLFWNAALPQFEAVTLFHLKNQTHRYSQIRLWGSIGFIAAVLGMGWFFDQHPVSYLPYAVLALLLGNCLAAWCVPEARLDKADNEENGMGKILAQPEVLVFLLVCLLLQVAHAPYYIFYSLYLSQHGYPATLTGGLWALGVAAEILLFINMGKLLRWFSLRHILLCSIALGIVRWLLIANFAGQLPVLMAAQLLHAATFGGTHATAIHLVHRYFGNRHQGKGQALFGSVSYGLGGLLGGLYSGPLWEAEGGALIYTVSAIGCTLALLLGFLWIGKENHQNPKRFG